MPEYHGEQPMVWAETRTTVFFRRYDEPVPLQLGDRIRPVEWEMDSLVKSHGYWTVGDFERQFEGVIIAAVAVTYRPCAW